MEASVLYSQTQVVKNKLKRKKKPRKQTSLTDNGVGWGWGWAVICALDLLGPACKFEKHGKTCVGNDFYCRNQHTSQTKFPFRSFCFKDI